MTSPSQHILMKSARLAVASLAIMSGQETRAARPEAGTRHHWASGPTGRAVVTERGEEDDIAGVKSMLKRDDRGSCRGGDYRGF